MISVDEHLARILSVVRPLSPLDIGLLDAQGCNLDEDVVAPAPLPGFDNSAMDGYAVRTEDLHTLPVVLPVVGDVAAGPASDLRVQPGLCVRIMTGAALPVGADAVVPLELTDGGVQHVRIDRAVAPGAYVRRAGEDVAEGETVLSRGSVLGSAQIGLGAAVGRSRVLVRPRPRVVVVSTGSELVEPGSPTGPGQIADANSFALTAAATEAGAQAYRVGIVPDEPRTLLGTLEDQLVRADVLVTSGGVSVGAYDVVKEVLSRIGTVQFDKVAMQPGMPQGFGTIGPDSTPVFGLPGNPVSALISFEVFVRPALRRMLGAEPLERPRVSAVTTEPLSSVPRQALLPAGAPRGAQGGVRGDAGQRPGVAPARRDGPRQRPRRPARGGRARAGRRPGDGAGAGAAAVSGPEGRRLTHVDDAGAARMVDVTGKDVTARTATATGRVELSAEVVALLRGEGVPKGDALAVARVAGIMGAKRTPDLVPLCHPLALSGVTVDLVVEDAGVAVTATARTADRTGVEMEALTAVSVACLTLVDMCKAVDPRAVISGIRVEAKTGGKSGSWTR